MNFQVGDKVRYIGEGDEIRTHGNVYTVTGIIDWRQKYHKKEELFLEHLGDSGHETDSYAYEFELLRKDILPEDLFTI